MLQTCQFHSNYEIGMFGALGYYEICRFGALGYYEICRFGALGYLDLQHGSNVKNVTEKGREGEGREGEDQARFFTRMMLAPNLFYY